MPAKAPHKGKTLYLKGMPSQLGGHNIYEDTEGSAVMAQVAALLPNELACSTSCTANRPAL